MHMRVGGLVGNSTIFFIPTFRKQPMHNNGIEITTKNEMFTIFKRYKEQVMKLQDQKINIIINNSDENRLFFKTGFRLLLPTTHKCKHIMSICD